MGQAKLIGTLDTINRLHQAQADFEKSLALLASLKAGETSLDEVEFVPGGWQIVSSPAPVLVPEPIKERIAGNGTLEGTMNQES